jgi:hypothetical protein
MFRPISALIGLSLASLGLLCGGTIPAAWALDQHVKVEIKGELKKGTGATGQPVALLLANGLQFELSFGKTPPPSQELDRLYGKTVVAVGTLEKHRAPGGQEHLVCVVQGTLKTVDAASQSEVTDYLVGYTEGNHEPVKKLCEGLGLKVLEHYKPGKYLRVQPGSEAKANFFTELRDNHAVRYVEPNATYKIPGGENLPTTPQRP